MYKKSHHLQINLQIYTELYHMHPLKMKGIQRLPPDAFLLCVHSVTALD